MLATEPARVETPAVDYEVHVGDVLDAYGKWPTPASIISDGAYGLRLFPGDPPTIDGLVDWYRPHVEAWSKAAGAHTTLWFWNSELGWATVHPLLVENGWEYETAHIWDKGIGHIAGNVNGVSIRRFPVVSEVAVFYSRKLTFAIEDGTRLPAKVWMRHEWRRSGLPLTLTNEACGVKNAATRKYFTQCHLWYMPPPEMIVRLADYATKHGRPTDRPYFTIDGTVAPSADEWAHLRYKWNHVHGLTNVWQTPTLAGAERVKAPAGGALHANQKPLALMTRILAACTKPGDVVWEPFGGLCSASYAAIELGRVPYAAENQIAFLGLARQRLEQAASIASGYGQQTLELVSEG